MTFSPGDDDRLWTDPEKESWFRFSSPLRYLVFLVILVCLIIGGWYLVSPARRSYNRADLALIRADDTPFKVKAKDQEIPGIKHQDKLVYGRIRDDQNTPSVEHILPDPEPPLVPVKEEAPSLKMVDPYIPNDGDPGNPNATQEKPSSEERPALSSIEDLIPEEPDSKPTLENKEIKGTALIQLGSLKSYDLAESEWNRISKKNKDILGGLEPKIQKVDLGAEQGIYYRLRAGPLESDAKAKNVCAILKDRKVECIVVR